MRFLRTNTACRVSVGPFFDKTDGVTPETALTVTACKLTFMVDDGNVPTLVIDAAPTASGGNNDMVHVTGDDAGFYDLELTAANTNYLGRAMLAITDAATHCPIFHEFMILPAVVYDAMVLGTDNLQVDTVQVTGTAQTARDLGASVLLSSGTGTGQISLAAGLVTLAGVTHTGAVIPTVTTTTTATNVTTVNGLAAGVITDASIAADAITDAKVASDVTIASVTGAVGSVTGAVGSVTGNVGGNVTGSVGSISGVTFPTNFSDLAISVTTGLVDITQTAADKAWSTTTRRLSDGTNIVLAKGVGVTGFNDIAATDIVSAGAITTSSGAVSTVTTVGTTTNLTNAATNGDLTATMKTSVTTAATAATPTVTLANGAHGGASASLTMQTINVSNSAGDAVSISATGSNGHGVYVIGNGGGDGMHVVGGATGHGLHLQGGSTSGDGLHTVAQTAGDGIQSTGAGGGLDINGTLSAVTLATTTTTLTNLPAITTDWLTGTGVAASAVTKIQAGLSTYAGADTAGTTDLLTRLTATRAGYLDNLSGGAVMLASSYSAPPSAATISTQVASDLATVHGAGSWATATGFSTHSAADVWAVATRVLTAGTNIALAKGVGVTGFNDLSAAQVNAEVDTALADYDAPTNTEMVAAFTEIKGATWATTDTLEAIRDRGDAAWITATGFATAASLTTVEGKIDTIDGIVDSILIDTAEIGPAGEGLTALASAANLATANTALAKLDDTVEDNAGTFRFTTAALINAPSGSGLDAAGTRAALGMASANLDSQLSAIVTDTNELQTDWVNGGRLDLILDARSSQTSVDDLPTNAELATALGTADDAVLAAIAALNDITTGEVRTELATELARIDVATSTRATPAQVATELGTYDAPTNAEMVAAFTEVKGATWATTDTLEAIRDRGDAAWLTATGFSTHSAADVRTELAVELARIDAAVSTRATPAQVATELGTYDAPTKAELDTAIDALPTAAENAAALMDLADGIETSITLRQAVRLILAASAGELSGAATTTITIRNVGDTKTRLTATVDADGNRSSVVVDGT